MGFLDVENGRDVGLDCDWAGVLGDQAVTAVGQTRACSQESVAR